MSKILMQLHRANSPAYQTESHVVARGPPRGFHNKPHTLRYPNEPAALVLLYGDSFTGIGSNVRTNQSGMPKRTQRECGPNPPIASWVQRFNRNFLFIKPQM